MERIKCMTPGFEVTYNDHPRPSVCIIVSYDDEDTLANAYHLTPSAARRLRDRLTEMIEAAELPPV